MGLGSSLAALFRANTPVRDLDALRGRGIDAYDLVDALPPGRARAAAWAAYVFQTYGDKLLAAGEVGHAVPGDTASVVRVAYELVPPCLAQARSGGETGPALPTRMPRWRTPVRTHEQLTGMREALSALHTYVAYELRGAPADDPRRAMLAEVDARVETVDLLWIERPPAELRGGMGDALIAGLDGIYRLGLLLADPASA